METMLTVHSVKMSRASNVVCFVKAQRTRGRHSTVSSVKQALAEQEDGSVALTLFCNRKHLSIVLAARKDSDPSSMVLEVLGETLCKRRGKLSPNRT